MATTSLKPKLSASFTARLDRLGEDERVRVVVLLAGAEMHDPIKRRLSPDERASRAEAARHAAAKALPAVRAIVERLGGRVLATEPSVLGSIPVETTPQGIRALAKSEWVRSILEDQPIGLLPTPPRG